MDDRFDALQEQLDQLRAQMDKTGKAMPANKMSMVVFSGDLDKALAAFIIAVGAKAMGMDTTMFFTFWGTPLLRDTGKTGKGKDFMSKMFGWMLPKGASRARLSQMHMAGMGTAMLKGLMKKKNVASLEEMISMAGDLGVKIYICEMSMDLMGFKREEMIEYPDLEYAGVATFLSEAHESKIQLFL